MVTTINKSTWFDAGRLVEWNTLRNQYYGTTPKLKQLETNPCVYNKTTVSTEALFLARSSRKNETPSLFRPARFHKIRQVEVLIADSRCMLQSNPTRQHCREPSNRPGWKTGLKNSVRA